jgi:short-subunit dehydrogenase
MRDLASRIALITGGSSGIGLATAEALAQQGMNLVLVARKPEPLERAAQQLRTCGAQVLAIAADVTDLVQLQKLVERVITEFGRIDVLVNCAGTESIRAFHQIEHADIERTIQLNLTATLQLTRVVIPHMLLAGRGHVVSIASVAGKFGPAYATAYAASKAGQIAFTQSLRAEYLASGISASVICPGSTRDAGLYEQMRTETGFNFPFHLGWTTSTSVAHAVVRAIRRDLPEVVLNTLPLRPLLALGQLFPRFASWLFRIGSRHHFHKVAIVRDNYTRYVERHQQAQAASRAA